MALVESQPEALLQPLSQAQAQIALWTARAAALQLSLRPPPPQPTSCCISNWIKNKRNNFKS